MFIDKLNKFEDNLSNSSIVGCDLLSKFLDLFSYLKESIRKENTCKQKQKQKPTVVYNSFKRIHLNNLEGSWYVLLPNAKKEL